MSAAAPSRDFATCADQEIGRILAPTYALDIVSADLQLNEAEDVTDA